MARRGGGPTTGWKDEAGGSSARTPGRGRQPQPRQPGPRAGEDIGRADARADLLGEPSDYPILFEAAPDRTS
jgi:hypothetical protein